MAKKRVLTDWSFETMFGGTFVTGTDVYRGERVIDHLIYQTGFFKPPHERTIATMVLVFVCEKNTYHATPRSRRRDSWV